MEYLDANVIIRFLTKDDPDQSERAYAVLQEVEQGTRPVFLTEAGLAEVISVLSSKKLYHLPRPEIVKLILPIILLKGLRIGWKPSDKQLYTDALHLYETTTLAFPDVLIIAHMRHEGAQAVISFDTDFDTFPDLTRNEPEKIRQ